MALEQIARCDQDIGAGIHRQIQGRRGGRDSQVRLVKDEPGEK
jgi:hypothetical protein